MTKTCLQCGAVLASSARVCDFCDSVFSSELPLIEEAPAILAGEILLSKDSQTDDRPGRPGEAARSANDPDWRGELALRMSAYRTRKRRVSRHTSQSRLPFNGPNESVSENGAVAVAEPLRSAADDFSFTIAIGREAGRRENRDARMEIDVSIPALPQEAHAPTTLGQVSEASGMYPIASLDERRIAALVDTACLLFAYGGFVALFGSLGGQFTASKLSAAVYAATIAIVYLQYFALFTIFGGTTPGMMFRGLQVTSFTGDPPTPRQMLLRSLGYVLSGGTFFLGFLWAWWDEDGLTWHDRLSRTYLSAPQPHADIESSAVAPSR